MSRVELWGKADKMLRNTLLGANPSDEILFPDVSC